MRRKVRDEDEIGELNIVPYLDIVTNLVMFILVSMVGLISLGVLDVGTPKIGAPDTASAAAPAPSDTPPLTLTVAISDKGFFVAGTGGVLPGDTGTTTNVDTERPPTVPRKNGLYDYAALGELLAMIKVKFPNETRVILLAEDDIAYDFVIQTMDACRERKGAGEGGGNQTLFPNVWLSTLRG
ncbi:MAG: biopolymer transporter ExbD [Myxococcota bacterium]